MDAECSPSLAASWAAEAKAGASQAAKPRQLSLKRLQALGTPSHPASTLPMASTVSGTVMDAGDSWTCAATSGATRDLP